MFILNNLHLLQSAKLIGDVDADKQLTVLDATKIQKVMAQLEEFDESNDISKHVDFGGDLDYISDFDHDGKTTILDAAEIQLVLAGIKD